MSPPRLRRLAARLATHALLLAGAVIFAAPLLWMLVTSTKLPREMAGENVRLFPPAPIPRSQSPYIDNREFGPPQRPEGVAEEVWEQAELRMRLVIGQRLSEGLFRRPVDKPALMPEKTLISPELDMEMLEGLFKFLRDRLSDEARAAGADAIEAETRSLLDERAERETFEGFYRQLRVGDVRLRTQDSTVRVLSDGRRWNATVHDAFRRWYGIPGDTSQPIEYSFGAGHKRFLGLPIPFEKFGVNVTDSSRFRRATFVSAPGDLENADRIFISLRGDESWNKVRFEVVTGGRLYRSYESVRLYQRDWFEVELRFPESARDPLEPRTYLSLKNAGPAPAGSADSIQMIIGQASYPGAWWARISRAYAQAFREVPFARFTATSFSLCLLNIILTVLSCTLVGYAFARLEWPGRDVCFAVLLATMMLPPQVTMVPQFILFRALGWYNTLLPLWVPAAFGAPFFIFLVRQFLKNVPKDLEDAARIDGCGFLRVYWHVMLPLVRPVIATIAIFSFLGTWNNFMGPLVYLNDERLFPLALGLFRFQLRGGDDATLMMAGSVLMTIPVLILFASLQRVFVQGIALSGTKE